MSFSRLSYVYRSLFSFSISCVYIYISFFLVYLSTYNFTKHQVLHWLKLHFLLEIYDAEPQQGRATGGQSMERTPPPPPFFFSSHLLTRHPHRPQQGVLLCHKSPGSLNHATDAPLAFLIAVVHLHLYSIREINGSGHGT